MAGVVAMASVIEDFDTQPCKKSSKDGGNSVVKTITSYFSPVAKAVEKPFSPPRSNNIMDYFSRGSLTSKGKTSPLEQPKETSHESVDKHAKADVAVKQPPVKRRRKATKVARKLVEPDPVCLVDDSSCFVVEALHENTSSAGESSSVCGVFGSDAAVLLAQLSSEIYATNGPLVTQKEKHHDDASKCGNNTSSTVVKDKCIKTSGPNSKKSKQKQAYHSESEEKVSDSSPCEASIEVDTGEDSQLNSSTIMISFKDFVRTQSESAENVLCEGNKALKDSDGLDNSNSGEASKELSIQVSPRTITIQAQMHSVSPKQELGKPPQKAASPINRRKATRRPAKESPVKAKQKSNVVLEEEELDLAVLESESTPKCPNTEKRHFMAAFRQPSIDGCKTNKNKNQTKQKQPSECGVDNTTEGSETQETKKAPNLQRKGKKKAEETVAPKSEGNGEEPHASNPSVSIVRRSRREAVVKQAVKASPETRGGLKDSAPSPKETFVKLSTSKTHKSKHGVYAAEMVCPPDRKESPIRIKFRRVHQNVPGGGKNLLVASIVSNDSKKQRKAKQLVEKAKAIQKSKKSAAVEAKNTLRRSSRAKASIAKSYCEDEDSVICLEEEEAASPQVGQQNKSRKSLRSLNEVLGKAAKAPPGSKVAVLGHGKNASKTSDVISIIDESSREGSENSQDDEQFRARRDFLKSGLPESFKKQINKAVATKEAYALSCSSFQPVMHLTQPPTDCPLWGLPWPESPKLCHLKELSIQVSKPPPILIGSFAGKKEPDVRVFCERGSGWRPEMSENVRQILVEEVKTSNPPFPFKTFLPRLLARRAEHQHPSETASTHSLEPVGGKRKRKDDEGSKLAKKQRAACLQGSSSEPETPKRGGRTRRTQRGTKLSAEEGKDRPLPGTDNNLVVLDDLPEDTGKKVFSTEGAKEDVLWTEKYQPQHSSDIIGNASSVQRLHSWLKEWKLRADREERNKQKEKKREEDSNDCDWDCGDDDPLLAEDSLCNTVLITGPTGIGKTATVYACAHELGFKVFEVNASSQRSGRLILSQLKEATQSHQVDSQGVNAHKPTYFNSYSANSAGKHGVSPRKLNSPRSVMSSPRKTPQSPRDAKKGGLAPTSLANFFKMGKSSKKELSSLKQHDQKASIKQKNAQVDTPKQKKAMVKSHVACTVNKDNNEEQSKKTPATSLILFEEVDVIFDEDSGFLAAIKTFMSTTKRPVILTTSDPAFSTMFDGIFEEINFKTPSLLDVSSYLRLLCLAEDTRTEQRDVSALLQVNGGDIRQSLLQLQCWTRSAGGRHVTTPSLDANLNGTKLKADPCGEQAEALLVASPQPPCESGCTESLLGLLNIQPEEDIWELLGSRKDEAACWELVTESSRRRVNILYSNIETLLPLPCTQLTTTYKLKPPSDTVQSDTLPSQARQLQSVESADCSDDGSPVKVSHRMKKNKIRHRFPDHGGGRSDSDSEESFLSLCKLQTVLPPTKAQTNESLLPQREKLKPLTPEERLRALPVSQCLDSISDFFDSMSVIDSLLAHRGDDVGRGNLPVSTALKDGMTDDLRVEMDTLSWVTGERVLEIQAAVEEMSFQKCRHAAVEALDRARQLDVVAALALPVASHCEGRSFTQRSLCQPQLVLQRRDIMESLVSRGAFGTLGNRSAAAVDYLPALRTICRSEQLKEQGRVKRRFLHYLDSIHLGLSKDTLQYLTTDFQ
ncbi:ATPase family AAA domain-containing protein 5 isoform X1 [Nerophis lumbriciformis]|uniref:ATPase family AAA domain-containing protein 5 isoform X1 n=1 Tax=Nerophis lumbriciformis TaxID=546530 RepID=UPI002ADFD100|nr:ATPase family AAA domain-containing protein 5-like isoform X1 [Nerophis lumbriciformis]